MSEKIDRFISRWLGNYLAVTINTVLAIVFGVCFFVTPPENRTIGQYVLAGWWCGSVFFGWLYSITDHMHAKYREFARKAFQEYNKICQDNEKFLRELHARFQRLQARMENPDTRGDVTPAEVVAAINGDGGGITVPERVPGTPVAD